MPQLLLICIQIICFCLTWALVTFQIEPFLDVYQFIKNDDIIHAPEWTIHTQYLFALIFLTTGITSILRLKVLKHLISTALTFFIALLICMAFSPELHILNVLKYSYIVLIPFIFHRIFNQNIQHIDVWIKTTLQIPLIFIPFSIGYYVFNDAQINNFISIIITSTLTLVSVGASLGLYIKDYFRVSLRCAEWIFFIGFATDLLHMLSTGFDYNQLPMILIGISLILFARWSRIVSK